MAGITVAVVPFPIDPPLTQDEFRQRVQSDKQRVLYDMAEKWRNFQLKYGEYIKPNGERLSPKVVGLPSFAVEIIGGKLAMVERSAFIGQSKKTWNSTSYTVPLGDHQFLITMGRAEGNPQVNAALDRIKKSIVIQ